MRSVLNGPRVYQLSRLQKKCSLIQKQAQRAIVVGHREVVPVPHFAKDFDSMGYYNAQYLNTVNFGPQHPSTHGVLRVVVKLDGEHMVGLYPHIGYLHRGTEKLIESKTVLQAIPYCDRTDYICAIAMEESFVLAVEKLLKIDMPVRMMCIRTIMNEIGRLINHLFAICTHALDLGALTPFLWIFEEREHLMTLVEQIAGARMHLNYFRPGGVAHDFANDEIMDNIVENMINLYYRIMDMEELLTGNRIFRDRIINVGRITAKDALRFAMTGPCLRSTGIPWDLRRSTPYGLYPFIPFRVPIGVYGDCFDRYIQRMDEMRESIGIILHCLTLYAKTGESRHARVKAIFQPEEETDSIEGIIRHFTAYGHGLNLAPGITYASTEAPKGEYGVFMVTNGTQHIERCKYRMPSFMHLSALNLFGEKLDVPEISAIIGSLDIVLGEIDR
eukprot:TRINITY_DN11688_c0_g1_i1.p1 TRINITY_DN11688_c0_g1~~TRINITY_DN11688_c0_g1_i1.p1  ORF type:complete len:460 (+),score=90.61 TRINITY_DN11688_c0_g1_i1:46-1380(+)